MACKKPAVLFLRSFELRFYIQSTEYTGWAKTGPP